MRFLLLPFSWIYTLAIYIRNSLYDCGALKSNPVKNSIGIGNLSMGGTGKTPLTIYLAQWLIDLNQMVFILSRGYKRNTDGYIEVQYSHQSDEVGDEPLMYKKRFKDEVNVVVSKNRWFGSKQIKIKHPEAYLLFDDVFQHRKVKPDFSILTSSFNDLFIDDMLIPAGRLREPKKNVKRGDCILITRCPHDLSDNRKKKIREKLHKYNKPLFFCSIKYEGFISFGRKINTIKKILLVTGIANNQALISHLQKSYEMDVISYPDHYSYTQKDMEEIHQKFGNFAGEESIILTTEKDMVRMLQFEKFIEEKKMPLYYQPISIDLHNEIEFKSLIKENVGEI